MAFVDAIADVDHLTFFHRDSAVKTSKCAWKMLVYNRLLGGQAISAFAGKSRRESAPELSGLAGSRNAVSGTQKQRRGDDGKHGHDQRRRSFAHGSSPQSSKSVP